MPSEVEITSTLNARTISVVIVGAGLGGLACAIACRQGQHPLDVTILERSEELLPVGAGIQLPPNATRVMAHFGLMEKLKQAGAITVEGHTLRRYRDGHIVVQKPLGNKATATYGAEWMVIHRADYQNLLLEKATDAGARLVRSAEVISVESGETDDMVVLKDGRRFYADMIIGADGLWSRLREFILDRPSPPLETGDLAYRGTFSLQELTALNDPEVEKLVAASNVQVWMGPEKHIVFYPVRNKTEFNLVLLCPDDLPKGSRTSEGDLEEMRSNFEGWDPALRTMISCLGRALKWKLCHHKELQKWTKGTVTLLGDACHPTLPYQAQGAAMAVEDGAVLGQLLTTAQSRRALPNSATELRVIITDILRLYEILRKERTETNVRGAVQSREFYHLCDGNEQMERDNILSDLPKSQWTGYCKWNWGDAKYQQSLLGFDVLTDAAHEFNTLFGLRV